ncbi:PepSY domain-containing protein [Asticcacaulis sp. 201]|uniref:PepSY-associated TM helix domain-containing protein n=1 Tax=Asticcacaulis sp. 201 TaxID=3028787 RepID=UPI0029160786|nr:PepSY domain-containing protein [Asticcacaulis sp. 201]MDV6329348.1 PepSY domain-containing protein [Asticcacaulis sp. 201]
MEKSKQKIIDYRMFWRWHFYAGLVCIPFIVILSITGPIYLFKPQIEAAIDAPYDHLPFAGAPQSAQAMVAAATAAVPGARFKTMEVRPDPHDAARIIVVKGGEKTRVYVHPLTLQVLKQVPEDARFMAVVKDIHGELFAGRFGQVIVELAACWAIVMILTGLYLWWPRGIKGIAGLLYPRLGMGTRIFWRDIHAVVGIYVSAFALFLLITGLPWTYVWGNAFKSVRAIGSHATVSQAWSQGRADEHRATRAEGSGHTDLSRLDALIDTSRALNLPPPVLLSAPAKSDTLWKLQSDTGNRPQRVTLMIDPMMQDVISREDFHDKKALDQAVGYGIAAHEGQLFGPLNQALGVLTAIGLMTLCVSAIVMWWQRRPSSELGAPQILPDERLAPGLAVIIIALGIFLPVLGISLIVVGLFEGLVLRRIPAARRWLGLKTT